MPLILEKQY